MELQEAIDHAREVTTRENVCESCRGEHGQLADWLEELKSIREILGDCDLDRLAVMMNQCMSMRDEVAERFRLTAKIPLDRLKDLVELEKNIPHVCRFCVGCEMEPKDGHGCDEYDSFVFSTRHLWELVGADRDGRCVVLPQKTVFELTWDAGPGCDLICPISIDGEGQCDFCDHGKLFVYEQECRQEHLDRIGKTIFLTREDAEAAMKGEGNG